MVGIKKPRVGLFISNLEGGGVQRVILNLAKGLNSEGIDVDLLIGWPEGKNKEFIPRGVNLIGLKKKSVLACIPGLINYLRTRQPETLVTAQTHVNIVGIICRIFAGKKIRLVICEHNNMKEVVKANKKEWFRPVFARWLYLLADGIVAVSEGVADGLTEMTGIPRKRINILYNPLISEEFQTRAEEPISHPWFHNDSIKVILSVGRLENQKDFSTLIHAFHELKDEFQLRLIILGEGSQRENLQSLIDKLGLHEKVDMPGFKENPYSFMKHACLFVLSSKYEGFPSVLVEALACGVPVISTDCPSGPSEILEKGKFGRLVPVGNVQEMAKAIKDTLEEPIQIDKLISRGLKFNIYNSTQAYLRVIFQNNKRAK